MKNFTKGWRIALKLKFAETGEAFSDELRSVKDLAQLKNIQKAIFAAGNVDELRAILKEPVA